MSVSRLSISVPPEVEKEIRAAAKAAGVPVSQWLAHVATHAAKIQQGLQAVREYEAEYGPIPEEARRWGRHALEEDGVVPHSDASPPAESSYDEERLAS